MDEPQFLRDLDKKLWAAAERLRANLNAAVYKHAAEIRFHHFELPAGGAK